MKSANEGLHAAKWTVTFSDGESLADDQIKTVTRNGDGWLTVFRPDDTVVYYPPDEIKQVVKTYPEDSNG